MKLEKLEQLLTERALAEWLGVPFKEESGRSRTIGGWIAKGLRCAVIISGRRYFFESDVIDFFNDQARKKQEKSTIAKMVEVDTSSEQLPTT